MTFQDTHKQKEQKQCLSVLNVKDVRLLWKNVAACPLVHAGADTNANMSYVSMYM